MEIPSLIIALGVLLAIFLASRAWPVSERRGIELKGVQDLEAPSSDSIWIGTYNINRGRGFDRKANLAGIAEVIESCDIVGLQEVEGTSLFRPEDQATLLGRLLRRLSHFVPTRKLLFFNQRGNGLLSRIAPEEWHTMPVYPSRGRAHRNFTIYRLSLGGREVHLINTHLSKPAEAQAPFEAVMQAFKSFPRAVLVGDFNASVDHPVMRRFLPEDAVDALDTYSGFSYRRVEMIFVRGLQVLETRSMAEGTSDHAFYAASIALNE